MHPKENIIAFVIYPNQEKERNSMEEDNHSPKMKR